MTKIDDLLDVSVVFEEYYDDADYPLINWYLHCKNVILSVMLETCNEEHKKLAGENEQLRQIRRDHIEIGQLKAKMLGLEHVHKRSKKEVEQLGDELFRMKGARNQLEDQRGELIKETEQLKELIRRTVDSGLLCDPGCCGDDCVCDEIRKVTRNE
jgi:hypothetical protein